jgi:hypothetical protein
MTPSGHKLHAKRRAWILLAAAVLLLSLGYGLWLLNTRGFSTTPASLAAEARQPTLELTLAGAIDNDTLFNEADQFLEASCHASGFSFSLNPGTAPHALGLSFSRPLTTRPELSGSYSLAPGAGNLTIFLPASAENPAARVFEAREGMLHVSGNQGSFSARLYDSTGTALVASGRWHC